MAKKKIPAPTDTQEPFEPISATASNASENIDAEPGDNVSQDESSDNITPLSDGDAETLLVSDQSDDFTIQDINTDAGDAISTAEPSDIKSAVDDEYSALLQDLGKATTEDNEALTLADASAVQRDIGDVYASDESALSQKAAATVESGTSETAVKNRFDAFVPDRRNSRVLTIDARSQVQTEAERQDIIWHEIQNAHRIRHILTGTLDGVEKTESGLTLAIVNYKGFRVAIPVKEMMLYTGKAVSGRGYAELMEQLNRILNSRLGSEIDFIVKGYDNDSRSIVASRKDAMLRKRQTFYMDVDELDEHMIYEGRIVQARVVAVAEKVIRVEVFGVECSIVARNLSWEWIGNARDHFSVGDRILVRVTQIDRTDLEHLSIQVDARSTAVSNNRDNLKKCIPQCRYVGRVTDVRNGVVFIRLNNGVNAIAHSCYDLRTPGKKDDVSFAVTRLDEEQGVAIGIITRIIKQNL